MPSYRRLPAAGRGSRRASPRVDDAPPHPRRAVVLGTAARRRSCCCWPQALGLQNQWVAAHVVALRGAGGACARSSWSRSPSRSSRSPAASRRFGIAMAVVLALFAAGNVAVLADARHSAGSMPTGDSGSRHRARAGTRSATCPTRRRSPTSRSRRAPTSSCCPRRPTPLGEEVAIAMREGGSPMWVHTVAFDDISKARSTHAAHQHPTSASTGRRRAPPARPATRTPCRASSPSRSTGRPAHRRRARRSRPIRWELRNWRSDLDWLAEQCAGDERDHGRRLQRDARPLRRSRHRRRRPRPLPRTPRAAGDAGGLGTWPTDLPQLARQPDRPRDRDPRLEGRRVPRHRRRSTAPAATTVRSSRASPPAERRRLVIRAAPSPTVREWMPWPTRATPAPRPRPAASDGVRSQRESLDHTQLRGVQGLHRQRLGRRDETLPPRRASRPPFAAAPTRTRLGGVPRQAAHRARRRHEAARERHRLPVPRALGVRAPHRLGIRLRARRRARVRAHRRRPRPPRSTSASAPAATPRSSTRTRRSASSGSAPRPSLAHVAADLALATRGLDEFDRVRRRRRHRRRVVLREADAAITEQVDHAPHPLRRRGGAVDERVRRAVLDRGRRRRTSPTPSSPGTSASCGS